MIMGSTQPLMDWKSEYEIDENPFPSICQFPSYDFSGNGINGDCALDFPYEFAIRDSVVPDDIPLMESFPDPLYQSLAFEPTSSFVGYRYDEYYDIKQGLLTDAAWDEIDAGFESEKPVVLLCNSNGQSTGKEIGEGSSKVKRCREERSSMSTRLLSRKTISQYFYMPITQAAKELNVGLTLLKKRCRELGIRRWPHRKLMSLRTLIKNVQELGKEEGQESEEKLRNAIEILEKEKQLMEEVPDMQLENNTKRLRQACFKANYKKRKLMGLMDPQSSLLISDPEPETTNETSNYDKHEQDFKTTLPGPHSSYNTMY